MSTGVAVYSLKKKAAFRALRKDGCVRRSKSLKIIYRRVVLDAAVCLQGVASQEQGFQERTLGGNAIRVAFAISKRISKKATVRNRIKRRLRAALNLAAQSQPCSSEVHMLVIPSIHALTQPFQTLVDSVGGYL